MQTYTTIALLSLLGITLSASAALSIDIPSRTTRNCHRSIYVVSANSHKEENALPAEAADGMSLWNPALTMGHYNNFNRIARKLVPQLTCFEAGFEVAGVDRSDFLGF